MSTTLTAGNDAYVADGGEIVHALAGNDQINIIHVDDSDLLSLDFDYFAPAEIYGNQGDDFIRSFGFGDRLYGDSGNDTLYGGGGDDDLRGGSGEDTIFTGSSGAAGDLVWAGTGNDTVHLQNAGNDDTIRGEAGYDVLHLYNSGGLISQFSLIAGGSNSGLLASEFEELHYYGGSGFEVVEGGNAADTISSGGGTDVIAALGGNDWINGGSGADVIGGGEGDDRVYGGSGDDTLNGASGNDVLNGEAGDDVLADGDGRDAVHGGAGDDIIHTGEGVDTVYGGNDDDIIREEGTDYTFRKTRDGTLIEVPAGDTLRGESGDDDIRAGTGHDKLYGGRGDDLLEGGLHHDLLDGGDGIDTASYAHAAAGVTAALDNSLAGTGDAAGDSFISIERLAGSNHADALRGGGASDILQGNGGEDEASGGGGGDTVFGGDGDDDLHGDAGDDILAGEAGNDFLNGGAGADFMNGGDGTDTADYRFSAGVTVALDGSLAGLGEAAGDTFLSVERLLGSNSGADTLRGSAGGDSLFGNAGADSLDGRAGNDKLNGGAGIDTLTGGAGADRFEFFAQSEGGDSITDFVLADDTIAVTGAAFGGLAAGVLDGALFVARADNVAQNGSQRFVFRTTDDTLWFDGNGNGAGGAVLLADLVPDVTLTNLDILVL